MNSRIEISRNTYLNTTLFAFDEVIIEHTEEKLHLTVYKLNQLSSLYHIKISLSKTKTMGFSGNYPIGTKIAINNTILEPVTHFQYLGCDISYE